MSTFKDKFFSAVFLTIFFSCLILKAFEKQDWEMSSIQDRVAQTQAPVIAGFCDLEKHSPVTDWSGGWL